MDSQGNKGIRFLNYFLMIVGVIGSTISWYLEFNNEFPSINWQLAAIIFFVIFMFNSLTRIFILENMLWQRKPNIVIHDEPYIVEWMIAPRSWYISSGENSVDREIPKFAIISFSNEPKFPTELNHAKKLTVKLTYKDEKGDILIGPIYANWGEVVVPSENCKRNDFLFHDLDSNGFPKGIIFAIKYDSSESCYAFNYDSFYELYKTIPDYRIEAKKITVEIYITGERVNKKFYCILINNGKGFPLLVEKQIFSDIS